MTKKDFFYCYDKNLYQFIKQKGVPYITKARRLDNLCIFTMYEHNDELTKAINEYMGTK